MTKEKDRSEESVPPCASRPKLTKHVTVRIAHEEFEVLKKLAAKEKDHHMSAVLRRILEAYLEERDRNKDCPENRQVSSSSPERGYVLR
jgi:hypothetical protein